MIVNCYEEAGSEKQIQHANPNFSVLLTSLKSQICLNVNVLYAETGVFNLA